jgi:hypothetical protein
VPKFLIPDAVEKNVHARSCATKGSRTMCTTILLHVMCVCGLRSVYGLLLKALFRRLRACRQTLASLTWRAPPSFSGNVLSTSYCYYYYHYLASTCFLVCTFPYLEAEGSSSRLRTEQQWNKRERGWLKKLLSCCTTYTSWWNNSDMPCCSSKIAYSFLLLCSLDLFFTFFFLPWPRRPVPRRN